MSTNHGRSKRRRREGKVSRSPPRGGDEDRSVTERGQQGDCSHQEWRGESSIERDSV